MPHHWGDERRHQYDDKRFVLAIIEPSGLETSSSPSFPDRRRALREAPIL
jgi:hypothetical protein